MSWSVSFFASPPDERYVAAISSITGFASSVAQQAVPGGVPVDQPGVTACSDAIGSARACSLQWFNSVYPGCLDVPAAIDAGSDAITAALTGFSSVAAQWAANPSDPQLHAALTAGASNLGGLVQNVQASCGALVAGMDGYAAALNSVLQQAAAARGVLRSTLWTLRAQVCSDQARVDALEHATCPNSTDIEAAQAVVVQDTASLEAVQQLDPIMADLLDSAGDALSGLGYLSATWTQITAIVGGSISALQRVAADPATVAEIDLQTATQAWQSLLDRLTSIASRAAA